MNYFPFANPIRLDLNHKVSSWYDVHYSILALQLHFTQNKNPQSQIKFH